MATVGQPLLAPETGWKRIEETDSNFTLAGDGEWSPASSGVYSGGTIKYSVSDGIIEFNFTGTKLRYIGRLWPLVYASVINVYIDNILNGNFSQLGGSEIQQALNYEVTGLIDREHSVKIIATNGALCFDAIDIDINKSVLPYALVSTIINLTSPIVDSYLTIGNTVSLQGTVTNVANNQIKYKIEVVDSSNTVLSIIKPEISFQDSPITLDESFVLNQEMYDNFILITATDSLEVISTKKISFLDKCLLASLDLSSINFKSGEKIKITAEDSLGTQSVLNIDPVLAHGTLTELTATPQAIHTESISLTGTVGSEKGKVKYTILNGTTEVINQDFTSTPPAISQIFTPDSLAIGENVFTVNLENESGEQDVYTVTVTKNNNLPVITPTIDNLTIDANITDADNDKVQYRILINNIEKVAWSSLLVTPASFHRRFYLTDIIIGGTNTLRIEVKDEAGDIQVYETTLNTTNKNAVITIPAQSPIPTVPKNTPYQFDFQIVPPFYATEVSINPDITDDGTLGSGGMFEVIINKDDWAEISAIINN